MKNLCRELPLERAEIVDISDMIHLLLLMDVQLII